jgi:hypothetical protein
MAVTNVQEAFEEFEREKVRVPAWENDQAKRVHPKIRGTIEAAVGDLFSHAYLAGSYRRRVQTVRLHDVDIVVVLNDPDGSFSASARQALAALEAAAVSCELVLGCEFGIRAVKLEVDGVEFTVDLVAALDDPLGEVLLARHIPEEGLDDWTPARPQAQVEAASAKNDATGGVYVPGTRIVKFWNQRLGDGERNLLPSYLVESMLFWALEEACDYDAAVAAFFRFAKAHLSHPSPSVRCPGDVANFVDERLEDERRLRALAAVDGALVQVEIAESAADVATALDAWAEIFGPAFPAPSTDPGKLASALKSGSAVASGTGMSGGGDGRQVIPARSWSRQ